MQINRWLRLSISIWGIPLRCDLFGGIDQANFLLFSVPTKGLKHSKVRREKAWNIRKWEEAFENEKGKVVSSNFQERCNWENSKKNKNQNNAFCLPFIGFFTQRSQYQIWKANTYSILTNGTNRTWTTSIRVLN